MGNLCGAAGLPVAFFCANPWLHRSSSAINHTIYLLSTQNIERRLDLTMGMRVADAPRGLEPALVHPARVVEPAQLLQRLPTVVVGRGVIRIKLEQRVVLFDGFVQTPGIGVFHRQSVAREAVLGVLRHHALKDFESAHDPMLPWARQADGSLSRVAAGRRENRPGSLVVLPDRTGTGRAQDQRGVLLVRRR